ncbi:MAG: insulinase family protein [Candidatus Omnitrophica bacterium]|nr:insulinase family protein [Candidatus Omnitrophota bacterium]
MQQTKLDNGLRIVSHFMPARNSVSLGLWVGVGGRYEKEEESGISHFIEHIVFKGTKKRTCTQIKQAIEGVGGNLNAFTGEEFTTFLTKIPYKYLRRGLDVLSDMVLEPLLKEEDIQREKIVVCEEIKMYLDLPMHYVHFLLSQLLWPNHPLGRFLAGSIESVQKIDKEKILQYHKRHYFPQNIVIAAAGNIEHKDIVEQCQEVFSNLQNKDKESFLPAPDEQEKSQFNFFSKQTAQSHLCLGFPSFPRSHPQRYVLKILDIILGANMSSRLYQEVREKRGLAYEIGSQTQEFQDSGLFSISAGVENKNLEETLKVIKDELERIKEEVEEEEIERAKEFFRGQLLLGLESTNNYMLAIGEELSSLDRLFSPEEILKQIDRINSRDLKEVSRQIFKREKLNLAVIGDIQEKSIERIKTNLF